MLLCSARYQTLNFSIVENQKLVSVLDTTFPAFIFDDHVVVLCEAYDHEWSFPSTIEFPFPYLLDSVYLIAYFTLQRSRFFIVRLI